MYDYNNITSDDSNLKLLLIDCKNKNKNLSLYNISALIPDTYLFLGLQGLCVLFENELHSHFIVSDMSYVACGFTMLNVYINVCS